MNSNEDLTKENKQLRHVGKSFQVRTVRRGRGLVVTPFSFDSFISEVENITENLKIKISCTSQI